MIEQEMMSKLVSPLERSQQLIEHVTEGLLRGDTEKRASYYTQALAHGWMTPNEVRALENLPPLPGGDVAHRPMNTEPLAPSRAVPLPPDRVAHALAAHRTTVCEAMGRIVRRETDRARRNQTTPEKLRAWLHTYGAPYEGYICEALNSIISAHLALIGSREEPAAVTRRIATEHVAEFIRRLTAVASLDASQFHQALEEVLRQWEEERPKALSDRLLADEIDALRTLGAPAREVA
jgi:hypothetical protein